MSTEFINDQWRLPNAWNGSESNVNKQSNYSMDFDSSNSDYINVGTSDLVSGIFSISMWIKRETTGQMCLISKDDVSSNRTFNAYFNSSGALNFFMSNTGAFLSNKRTITNNTITDTNWHHLVFINNGDTTNSQIFIDGTEATYSTHNTGISNLHSSSVENKIGTQGSGSYYFNGKLDGVSIYNYALSSSQVTTLYGSSSTGIGNPMSLNPVAYYPLGDQDAFNGANYLVPNSSLQDYVFDFDGTNDRVYGPSGVFSNQTATTISFWVNPDALTGVQNLFSNGAYPYFRLYFNTGNSTSYLWVTWPVSGNNFTQFASGMTAGQWHLFVFKWESGSKYQIYIDNDLKGESASTITGTYTDTDSLEIGNAPSNQGLQGKISNFKTWDVALTTSELTTLYNNGSPIQTLSSIPQNSDLKAWYKLDASATYDGSNWTIEDSSSNSNTGTSSGMTQANLVQSDLSFKTSYSPFALNFDSASSDKITGTGTLISGNDSRTISLWYKTTSTVSQIPFSLGAPTDLTNGSQFAYSMHTATLAAIYGKNSYYDTANFTVPATNDGNWHHLVVTYDQSSLNVYIDGNLEATPALPSLPYVTSAGFTIGGWSINNNRKFDGQLSNVSIWNTALTSTQVTEIYNEGVPSNLNNHSAYSNLVSWWQLGSNSSFNTNWTVLDEKGSNNGTSANMTEADIVDGVGSYANGVSSGMSDNIVGSAPFSDANSLSYNMDVLDRSTDVPN